MPPDTSTKRFARNTAQVRQAGGSHAKIVGLRQLIETLERGERRGRLAHGAVADPSQALWRTGISEIDLKLPEEGLSRYGLHEFSGADHAATPAASAYLLTLLRQLAQIAGAASGAPVLWCQTAGMRREFGLAHGAGLSGFGFDPQNFLFVDGVRNNDVLWALEEGARAGCLLAVIGEVDEVSFTQTRRLSLAAATTGTPVLLLRPHQDRSASAAETRWQAEARPGKSDPFVAETPGSMRWHIELNRCRGGQPGNWTVEWDHEAYRFRLAGEFRARSPEVAMEPLGRPRLRLASG